MRMNACGVCVRMCVNACTHTHIPLVYPECLIGAVKHPRPVFLVASILHERGECSKLEPSDEELLTAAQHTTA